MRKIFFFILLVISFSFFSFPISAQENNNSSSIKKRISDLENKLSSIRKQKKSLSSEIKYMNTRVLLTNLKIKSTEEEIKKAQEEIKLLDTRIDSLDQSLNYLSQLLIKRIVENYKERNSTIFDLLFSGFRPAYFINRIKYIKITRDNNQNLLISVQKNKTNFEEQKQLREEKKKKLDYLQKQLSKQKDSLNRQKKAKQHLLTITKNSEIVYERLLKQAKKELASFASFTKNAGGGLISFGSGSNGWFYTQRDPQWGNLHIGNSPYLVWQAGCALTSVAMVCKKYGQNITPMSMALDDSKFFYGDLLNNAFSCSGKTTSFLSYPTKERVKNYIQQNTPVIIRLVAPSVSGLHFIVLWKWDKLKNDFIIHDPYYGPDLPFSQRYSWSQVTRGIVIH